MILAIETATDVCAVAFENEEGHRFEKRVEARGSHSEKLFKFISDLMNEHDFAIADLEAVLVSEGPGSYTGLRIAASGVKGLLFDSDIVLYSVQTMAALATKALQKEPSAQCIHAVIDAKRKHLYHQHFEVEHQKLTARTEVEVRSLELVGSGMQPGDVIIGTGWNRLDAGVTGKVRCLGTDVISAEALITLFHRKEADNFIHKEKPEAFDPQYYTSAQV